jgi:uncharacterized protein YutE (UPF0331/DUF86 family)
MDREVIHSTHNYDAVNWAMVHSIAQNHLDDFSEFAKIVIDHPGPTS